ncbi:MAG: hypothetical protein LBC10_03185 [Deltaproteobacteria bacterium]|jgi:4-coumarate--CoA ligase|nr:hypothetical protein [Deltaproteobacteria bacterium]
MNLVNEHSLALALQSLTRSLLTSRRSGGEIFPLADMDVRTFAASTWASLDIGPEDQQELLESLRAMFPAPSREGALETSVAMTPGAAAAEIFRTWEAGGLGIVYASSGSSGIPKLLPHTLEEVEQEISCLARFFLTVRRIIGVTPQHHCYGCTFGVLMHRCLQVPYSILPPLPSVVMRHLSEHTLVVGYPDFWEKMQQLRHRPPEGLICLSAGSPWSDASMEAMLQAGYSQLREIYGSSENGAMGSRQEPGDFTLLDYWERDDVQVGDISGLLRALPSGRRKMCEAQDYLVWSSSRSFRPERRLDNAVQVSGINVYPVRVAQILEEHPQVAVCRVRLMRPDEGNRLKAFIVPREEVEDGALRQALKIFCKQRFSAPERPVKFSFGPAVVKNDFGKETDWP